jgi:hypothetical protein
MSNRSDHVSDRDQFINDIINELSRQHMTINNLNNLNNNNNNNTFSGSDPLSKITLAISYTDYDIYNKLCFDYPLVIDKDLNILIESLFKMISGNNNNGINSDNENNSTQSLINVFSLSDKFIENIHYLCSSNHSISSSSSSSTIDRVDHTPNKTLNESSKTITMDINSHHTISTSRSSSLSSSSSHVLAAIIYLCLPTYILKVPSAHVLYKILGIDTSPMSSSSSSSVDWLLVIERYHYIFMSSSMTVFVSSESDDSNDSSSSNRSRNKHDISDVLVRYNCIDSLYQSMEVLSRFITSANECLQHRNISLSGRNNVDNNDYDIHEYMNKINYHNDNVYVRDQLLSSSSSLLSSSSHVSLEQCLTNILNLTTSSSSSNNREEDTKSHGDNNYNSSSSSPSSSLWKILSYTYRLMKQVWMHHIYLYRDIMIFYPSLCTYSHIKQLFDGLIHTNTYSNVTCTNTTTSTTIFNTHSITHSAVLSSSLSSSSKSMSFPINLFIILISDLSNYFTSDKLREDCHSSNRDMMSISRAIDVLKSYLDDDNGKKLSLYTDICQQKLKIIINDIDNNNNNNNINHNHHYHQQQHKHNNNNNTSSASRNAIDEVISHLLDIAGLYIANNNNNYYNNNNNVLNMSTIQQYISMINNNNHQHHYQQQSTSHRNGSIVSNSTTYNADRLLTSRLLPCLLSVFCDSLEHRDSSRSSSSSSDDDDDDDDGDNHHKEQKSTHNDRKNR